MTDENDSDKLADGVVFDGRTIRFGSDETHPGEPNVPPEEPGDWDERSDESADAARKPSEGPAQSPDTGESSFLKFFDSDESDSSRENRFQRRFQTFFEPEALSEESAAPPVPVEPTAANDTDDASGEPPLSDDEPTIDEWVRNEQTEALRENLDAMNRSEEKESLYVLGAKYEPDDEVNMPDDEAAELSPTSILEAMLFVGDRQNQPLDLAKAADLMRNVSENEARQAVGELNRRYAERRSPYRIVEETGGFRLTLLPEVDSVRERFGAKVREVKLSQKAIDVLAVIAYRQPVTLSEIQSERPNAGAVVALLVKRGLVAAETKTVDKKPVQYYRTGERFLKLLGIDSLDDLPIVDEIDYR